MACRHFACDALRIITENTAKAVREGSYLTKRLFDILNVKHEHVRTSEEIIEGIRKKL
jgi:hypothetical protein